MKTVSKLPRHLFGYALIIMAVGIQALMPFLPALGEEISSNSTWRLAESPIVVADTVVVAAAARLVIEPGVVVQAHSNASLIVFGTLDAQGTEGQPITFTRFNTEAYWRGIAFLGSRVFNSLSATGILVHCTIEHATSPVWEPHDLSAAVSAEYSVLTISNCVFKHVTDTVIRASDSIVDLTDSDFTDCGEGINVVRSDARIVRNRFSLIKNGADAIDVDLEWSGTGWKPAFVSRNIISDVSGDGIDLGGSAATVSGNLILNCADKGISIGEGSNGQIENNVIMHCRLGIAVKDGSAPVMANNTIVGCETGVSCYEKSIGRGGARGHLVNSIVWNCDQSISLDEVSLLDIRYSCIQGESTWPGIGNTTNDPQFINIDTGNVLLQPGSPLAGMGTVRRAPTNDFHAVLRGASPTIGAFEDFSTVYDSDRDSVSDAVDVFPFHPAWSIDADGDNLPDNWEQLYFSGLMQMGNDDPDGDGLSNGEEFLQGLAPANAERMIVINEIMYHPTNNMTSEEYIELYNRGTSTVDLAGWQITDEVFYNFSPGTAMAPGEYIVIAGNPATVETAYGISNVLGPWSGLLGGGNGVVRLIGSGQANIDTVEYRAYGSWPIAPDGKGFSLELMQAGSDNNTGENWAASTTYGGTPGQSNSPGTTNSWPPTSDIVINEIMYHPAGDLDNEEYIELYNGGTSNVDLSGWTFTDGIVYSFPPGTILSNGQYLVIGHEPVVVTAKYGITGVLGPFEWGRLSNRGEMLELSDAYSNVVDAVYYHDRGRWPRAADGNGPSLELLDPQTDNRLPEAWQANQQTGSEGTPNSVNSSTTTVSGTVLTVGHFPTTPDSTEDVTVRARVGNDTNSVKLFWKKDADPSFNEMIMTNDGSGDLVYWAVIPPQTDSTLIEYYISVDNGNGGYINRPFGAPIFHLVESGNDVPYTLRYLCLDSRPAPTVPVFRILMPDETKTELLTRDINSNELIPITFTYLDEVFSFARIRYRGMVKRFWPIKSYRVDLRYDHPFAGGMRLNLNGKRPGPEWLATEYFRQSGFAIPALQDIKVYINNQNQGPYLLAERIGNEYLERVFPGAVNGQWYESWGETNIGAAAEYPPEIDSRLSVVFATNSPNYISFVTNVIAPDQWLKWLTCTVMLGDNETLLNGIPGNHSCYLHPGSGLLMLQPLDMDATFNPAVTNMDIHINTAVPYVNWRFDMQALDAFMHVPFFQRRYYQMIVDELDTRFTTARLTGPVNTYFSNVGSTLDSSADDVLSCLSSQPQVIESWITNLIAEAAGFQPTVTTATDGTNFWWPYTNGWITGIVVPDTSQVLVNGSTNGVLLDRGLGLWRFEAVLPEGDTILGLTAQPLSNRVYETGVQTFTVRYDGADNDSDTLPNSWELFYGLDPDDNGSGNIGNGRSGDPDGDGIPNYVEYAERTDPAGSNQYTGLRITLITLADTAMSNAWTALPGAVYQLQATENIMNPSWTNIGGVITAVSATVSTQLDLDGFSTRFYRVLLKEWP